MPSPSPHRDCRNLLVAGLVAHHRMRRAFHFWLASGGMFHRKKQCRNSRRPGARPATSTGGPTARADRRKTCTGSNSPPTAPPARALSPTSSVSATGRCSRSAKRCRAGCRSLVRVRHTPPETAQDWRPRRGEGRTRPQPLRPGLSRRCLVPLAGGPDRHLRPLIPGAASRERASSTACRSSPPTSAGLRPCHPAGSEVGPAIAARDILA